MVTMDLTISHKTDGVLTVTTNGSTEENEGAKNNTINETDVKGNNNTFKTEQNTDRGFHFQEATDVEKNPEEKSASPSVKKAIDLRTHNRAYEGNGRTIFEDAEYFSKNYSYKLLPITLENVDEEIIHTEHNYCTLFLCSESEPDEDCSRTMDYSQLKEKNYKKRKAKFRRADCERKSDDVCKIQDNNNVAYHKSPDEVDDACQNGSIVRKTEENERSQPSVEPLDLSAPPVKEQKTELCLKEHHNNKSSCINNNNNDNISININDNNNNNENRDSRQCDSDKENVKSKTGCIEVTITGPDEKENYQPCDMFLNDIARLVPKLIKKDCPQVEILDRTCDRYIDIRKNRLYYIISESTWRLFQTTNERVILTNDQNLVGQKADGVEINERPTYLIFDQFSLAKSLSEYCKQNGGCFEYKSVEEGGAEKKKEDEEKNVNEEESVIEMEVKERRGNVSENWKVEDEKIRNVGLNKIDVLERIGNGDLRNLKVDVIVEKEKQTGEIQAGSVVSKKDIKERNGKGEMETSMDEHKFFDEIIIRNLRDGNGRDVIERNGNREQRNFEVDKNVKEENRVGEVIIRNSNDANRKDVIKREGNEESRNWSIDLHMEEEKLVTEVQLRDGVNGKEVTERKGNGELRNKEIEMNMAEEKCLSKLKVKNSNDGDEKNVIERIENKEPINLEGDIIFEKENLVIKEEIKNVYDLVEIEDKKKNFSRREKLRLKTEEKPIIAEIKSFQCFTERQTEEMHEIKEEVVEKSNIMNKQRESALEMTKNSWSNDLENNSVLKKSINRVEKENLDCLRIWENELEKKIEEHSETETEVRLESGGLRQNVNVTKLDKMAEVEIVGQEEEMLGEKISKWKENDGEEEKSRRKVEFKNVENLFKERKNGNDTVEKNKLIMGVEEGQSTNRQMKLYNSENMKKEKEGDIKLEQENYENTEKETESFCAQKKRQVKCDVDEGKILMWKNFGKVEKESLKCVKVEENKIFKKTVAWRNSFEVAKEKSVIPKVKENSVFHDIVKNWEQRRHKEEPGMSDEIKLKNLNGLREKQEKFGLKEENDSWRRDLWSETEVAEEISKTVKSSPETEKETEEGERLRKIPQSVIETNQNLNTPKENFPDYNTQSKGKRKKTNANITEINMNKDEEKLKVDKNVESIEIRNMKKQVVGKYVPEENENNKYGSKAEDPVVLRGLVKVLSAEHPVEQPEREIRRNGNVEEVLIKNSLISINKVAEVAGKDGIEGSKGKNANEGYRPEPELQLEKVSTPEVASQFEDVGEVGGDLLEVKSGGLPKKKLEKEGESTKNEANGKKRQKRELKINTILRNEITQPKGKDDVKRVSRGEVKVQTLSQEKVMVKKVCKSEIHSEKSRKNDVSHWKIFLNILKDEEKIVEIEDQNNKHRLSQKSVPTPEEVIRENKISQQEEIAEEINFTENLVTKKEKVVEIEEKLENSNKSGSVISQADVKLEETKDSTADELKITEVMSTLGRLKFGQKNEKPQPLSHKEISTISEINQQRVNVEKIVGNKVSQWKEFSKETDVNRVQEENKTKEFRHGSNNVVPVVTGQSCLKNESEDEKILKTEFIKIESYVFENQKELLKRTNQTKLEEKKEEKTKDTRKFERKEIMVPFVLIHNSEEFNRRIKAEECKRIKENEGKKSKIVETEEEGSKKQNENILKDRKRLKMNLRKRKLVKGNKKVMRKKKFRKNKVVSENESGLTSTQAEVRRSERMMTKSGNEKGESSEFKTAVVKESSVRVGIRSKRKVEEESLTPDALTNGASQKSNKPKEGLRRGTKRKAGDGNLESKPEENQKKRRNSLDMVIMMSAEIGRESRLAKIKAEEAMSKEFDECGRKGGKRKMGRSKTKKKRKKVEDKMVGGERRPRLRPEQLVKNKNKKAKVKSKIASSKGRKR